MFVLYFQVYPIHEVWNNLGIYPVNCHKINEHTSLPYIIYELTFFPVSKQFSWTIVGDIDYQRSLQTYLGANSKQKLSKNFIFLGYVRGTGQRFCYIGLLIYFPN